MFKESKMIVSGLFSNGTKGYSVCHTDRNENLLHSSVRNDFSSLRQKEISSKNEL